MKELKKIILIILLIPLSLLYSCNGNGNSNTLKESASSSTENSSSSSTGDASFSATIDGTTISGNEIDEMQLTNTAFIYPASNESPQRLLFFLNADKKGDDFYSIKENRAYEITFKMKNNLF